MTGVRLDKWLWAARFYKTRGLSSEEIGKGRVNVNGQPAKASREVQVGDSIELQQNHVARTVRRQGHQQRPRSRAGGPNALRGNAGKHRAARKGSRPTDAPATEPAQSIEQGRPTKRDRRQLADWNRWSASVDPRIGGASPAGRRTPIFAGGPSAGRNPPFDDNCSPYNILLKPKGIAPLRLIPSHTPSCRTPNRIDSPPS